MTCTDWCGDRTGDSIGRSVIADSTSRRRRGGPITAPELVPFITAVPSGEFVPYSGNALASWKQVGETGMIVGSDLAGRAYSATVGRGLDALADSSFVQAAGKKLNAINPFDD